jgi:small multidrug resistance pump
MLAIYVLTTTSALIIMKLGTQAGLPIEYVNSKLQFNINTYTVIGIIMFGISFITYIYLISKNDLGYIIPLAAAFVYIIMFVGSAVIFKEVFTATKILGIALIVIGLIFLNLKR